MKNKKFSSRINKIIEFVGTPKTVIDVGCDHGFVGASLSRQSKVKKVYFNDISEKCLEKAKISAKEFGKIEKCEFDHGFGLSGFGGLKVETCIIAGMGGEEIVKILETKPKNLKIKNLCLQPATKMLNLKRWLNKNGFKIVRDEFFLDGGIYYNIFKAKKGRQNLDDVQLAFGEKNLKKPSKLFTQFVNETLEKKLGYLSENPSLNLTAEIENLKQAKRRIEKNERRN